MRDHISVCIITFRRQQMLERLLCCLKTQETEGLFDYSLVVVDNDAAGSAAETVARIRADLGLTIEYDIEAEQTIPAARNRALGLARGNYIGIIDDDEFARPDWLVVLYRAIQRFGVDAGLGPVYPFFSEEPPRWLLKGRFCERPVIRTGTILNCAQTRTGNVLLKREVFDRHDLYFDRNMKTSGSDRAFFMRAMDAGFKFIAVKEAPVYETVPPKRWTQGYFIKRAIIQGYNAQKIIRRRICLLPSIILFVKLAATAAGYGIMLPFARCIGHHLYVRCLESGAYNLSRLSALLGVELIKKRAF